MKNKAGTEFVFNEEKERQADQALFVRLTEQAVKESKGKPTRAPKPRR